MFYILPNVMFMWFASKVEAIIETNTLNRHQSSTILSLEYGNKLIWILRSINLKFYFLVEKERRKKILKLGVDYIHEISF
jgi:hypothetical protein